MPAKKLKDGHTTESKYCNKDEINANFAFEKECQPFADAFYISHGYEIDRIKGKKNKDYDVELTKNGTTITVEEKFLRQDLDIMFVETIQDTETNSPGWIEYTKAVYLLYMMPSRTLLCLMANLKKFIRYFGEYYKETPCTTGWGYTINKLIPLVIIIENKIGKDIGNLKSG